LDSISFQLFSGEKLGLIGKNGSGKSTLLRTIAGIYKHDEGEIKQLGEVVYISGFGIGLKPRLSMRNNIFLIGAVMGLTRKEIKKKFSAIVAFSELNDFVDTKVYQFSSGMIKRLCFSVVIHCLENKSHDIILFDEVFGSGGDLTFQNKAITKMENLIKTGAAVIIVSHDLEVIEKYCDRVLLLSSGQIIKEGDPKEVISSYVNNS
jgi:ABC-type polysaccharide/polyol phosphate transport system ATPase subunit